MTNCTNCTAPLPPKSFICAYCGAMNDVDLGALGEFTKGKPVMDRICPRCDIPLRSVDLKLDGPFYIERCEKCFGMFFDTGELAAFLKKTVAPAVATDFSKIDEINKIIGEDFLKIEYAKCPVCRELMHRQNYGARSGVIIDSCRAHGLWLDGGELKRIVEWKKAGGELIDADRALNALEEKKRRREEAKTEAARGYTAYAAGDSGGGGNDGTIAGGTIAAAAFEIVYKTIFSFFR
jgi:Zn-finger nucleic acid-binding protein